MLTYSFENKGKDSLYESLYKQIKADILDGILMPGEKLPSKRALAKHLSVSTITVESAYGQLSAEGYLYSVPKSGYFVADISSYKPMSAPKASHITPVAAQTPEYFMNFVSNSTSADRFPFSSWAKMSRETISCHTGSLVERSPSMGIYALRLAISNYLYQFRGMTVDPEQIIVGAGTEYLYGLLVQLLGHDKLYAVEDPGYQTITKIYQANHVNCVPIPIDHHGVMTNALLASGADILHISPSHHFPTGIVTPISRRYELLNWASSAGRYIIEDDYDSEFRFRGKPIPPLYNADTSDKVIYINTFSKSLASTIRISYLVLPKPLLAKYKETLSFYSCTVSNFEQYTLAKFIEEGYLEKHINRMRNYYRNLLDKILTYIKKQPASSSKITVLEKDAGLHFLMKVKTSICDKELVERAASQGILISCLSQYYANPDTHDSHTIVINYSGICIQNVEEAIDRLFSVI